MNVKSINWKKNQNTERYKAFIDDICVLDSAELELIAKIKDLKNRFGYYNPLLLLLQINWQITWINEITQELINKISYDCGFEQTEKEKVYKIINEYESKYIDDNCLQLLKNWYKNDN